MAVAMFPAPTKPTLIVLERVIVLVIGVGMLNVMTLLAAGRVLVK